MGAHHRIATTRIYYIYMNTYYRAPHPLVRFVEAALLVALLARNFARAAGGVAVRGDRHAVHAGAVLLSS